MLLFENDSELPLECITTFGVNVKENNNAIGYFGTGLKYALAVLMREDCEVFICIGGEFYPVTTKTQRIRGKDFDFIMLGDRQLDFTTELGKNWNLWQAYRELYSNCMDEGGEIHKMHDNMDDNIISNKGTSIFVSGLDDIHDDNGEVVISDDMEPIFEMDNVDVYQRDADEQYIYYKGIRVLTLPSKYSYNIHSGLTLTEDRTVSSWDVEWEVAKAIVSCGDIEIITALLSTDSGDWENTITFHTALDPCADFMRLVAALKKSNLPSSLGTYYRAHYRHFIDILQNKTIDPKIDGMIKYLRNLTPECNYEIRVALDGGELDVEIIDGKIVMHHKTLLNKESATFSYLYGVSLLEDPQYMSTYKRSMNIILDNYELKPKKQRRQANAST